MEKTALDIRDCVLVETDSSSSVGWARGSMRRLAPIGGIARHHSEARGTKKVFSSHFQGLLLSWWCTVIVQWTFSVGESRAAGVKSQRVAQWKKTQQSTEAAVLSATGHCNACSHTGFQRDLRVSWATSSCQRVVPQLGCDFLSPRMAAVHRQVGVCSSLAKKFST